MVSAMKRAMRWSFVGFVVATFVQAVPAGAAPPSPEAQARATELGRKAKAAREALRYVEAAELIDEANQLQPDARWLAISGECRMMAGELARAEQELAAALEGARLPEETRAKTRERLDRTKTARALLAPTVRARAGGDFAGAARAYDQAFELIPTGRYLVEAAALWEQAGALEVARTRFEAARARTDLAEGQPREVEAALARIETAMAPGGPGETPPGPTTPPPAEAPTLEAPSGGPSVLGWVLVGVGVAGLGLGVTGFVVSEDKRSEFEARPEYYREHVDQWQTLDDQAETWWNAGLIASGVGLATAITGVVLVVVDDDAPETDASVHVGAHALRGGAMLTALGRF